MPARVPARWPLLAALAGALVFSGALRLGFALDDVPLVRDNPSIRSPSGIPALFLKPYWETEGESYGLYRPVAVASLAVNRALTGDAPGGFHAVNVLLHAAVCALVWFAARRAGTHYGTAIAASLLFAVHPVHVEAVANIAGRAELLAAAFALTAWLLHGRGRTAAAAAAWGAAALSKETALLAPVVFLLDDRLRGRGGAARRALPYAVALAVAGSLRLAALGLAGQAASSTIYLDNPAAGEGTTVRVATALWVHARYVALALWPARLSSDYSFDAVPPVRSIADPRLAAGIAAAAAVAALFAWGFRRSRPVAIGVACWVLFLLPASNLLFASGTIMAERLLYLPSVGACLVAGHAAAALGSRPRRFLRSAAAAAVLVAAAALAARAALRVPDWKDNLTLALRDADRLPRSAKLQAGAGIALEQAGRSAEAEERFRRALSIWPDYAQMHFNLGVLLARRGERLEAFDHHLRASVLAPNNPRPRAALRGLVDDAVRRGDREVVERAMRTSEAPALAAYAAAAARREAHADPSHPGSSTIDPSVGTSRPR